MNMLKYWPLVVTCKGDQDVQQLAVHVTTRYRRNVAYCNQMAVWTV